MSSCLASDARERDVNSKYAVEVFRKARKVGRHMTTLFVIKMCAR